MSVNQLSKHETSCRHISAIRAMLSMTSMIFTSRVIAKRHLDRWSHRSCTAKNRKFDRIWNFWGSHTDPFHRSSGNLASDSERLVCTSMSNLNFILIGAYRCPWYVKSSQFYRIWNIWGFYKKNEPLPYQIWFDLDQCNMSTLRSQKPKLWSIMEYFGTSLPTLCTKRRKFGMRQWTCSVLPFQMSHFWKSLFHQNQ